MIITVSAACWREVNKRLRRHGTSDDENNLPSRSHIMWTVSGRWGLDGQFRASSQNDTNDSYYIISCHKCEAWII